MNESVAPQTLDPQTQEPQTLDPQTLDPQTQEPQTQEPQTQAPQTQTSGQHHTVPGYHDTKDAQLKRLRRIEGQVRGLQRMVEEETYCIDVLTQVSAVTRALQAVSMGLLEEHLRHCVVDAARESDEAGKIKIDEATAAIARLVRS